MSNENPPLNKFSFICKICGKKGKPILQEDKIKIKCECSNNFQTIKGFFLKAKVTDKTIKCSNHKDKRAEKYLFENKSYICNECFNNKNTKIEKKNSNWILLSLLIIILAFFAYFIIKYLNKSGKQITIIGVDFGSTFSGYSILLNGEIDFNVDNLNEVVSSEMIMDEYSKRGLFIGSEAHYFNKNKIEPTEKLYFSYFKRNLENDTNLEYEYYSRVIESNIPKNKTIKLEYVIKEFLEMLRKKIQNEKKMKDIKDIKWIIAVPSLWDIKGKKFMEEMAIDAGMINCEIALEPEVASLAIFHDKNIKKQYISKGVYYLIVDAGGYTLDISGNKILDENNNLEQLLMPKSYKLGSNLINEKIIDIMEKVYTKEKFEEAIKNNYESWGKTLDEIESNKKEIDFIQGDFFKIGFKFNEKCGSYFSSRDYCTGNYNETLKINYTKEYIYIPKKMVIDLISDLTNEIIGEINRSFTRVKGNIDVVVITGGFSQCLIFKNKIKESFKGMPRELIFLDSPQKTVMRGAAIFGLRPNQLLYRFSPVSIGIANYEYIKDNRNNNYCIQTINDIEGNLRCLKYELFIQRGESVRISQIFEKVVKPLSNSINVFYSYDGELNDENKEILGEIDIPESSKPLIKRTLTISIKFSNLINAKVIDDDNNEKMKILYYPS